MVMIDQELDAKSCVVEPIARSYPRLWIVKRTDKLRNILGRVEMYGSEEKWFLNADQPLALFPYLICQCC